MNLKYFSNAIANKINQIQPTSIIDNINVYNLQNEKQNEVLFTDNLSSEVDLYYALEFKDFELLSLILGGLEIEIDGELSGKLTTFTDSIVASLKTNLDYFKFWNGNELIYLSQLDLEFSIANKLSAIDPTELETEVNLKARKVFFESEFENLYLDLNYKNNIADIDFSVVSEQKIKTKLSGIADISQRQDGFTSG